MADSAELIGKNLPLGWGGLWLHAESMTATVSVKNSFVIIAPMKKGSLNDFQTACG